MLENALDYEGLKYYDEKSKDYIQTAISNKVDKVSGKGLSTNDYTTTEKTKLSGIASGAEVNQNAFSNIKVGSTTIAADSKTDTLTLVAGDNITITPSTTNDTVTISASIDSSNLAIQQPLKITDDAGVSKNIIQVLNPTPDEPTTVGSEVVMSAGGNVFIGGGDTPNTLRTNLASTSTKLDGEFYTATGERLYLSADNAIWFYSNCNTIGERKGMCFDTNGVLRPLVTNSQNLGSSDNKWANVYATTFNGLATNALQLNTQNVTTADTDLNDYTTSGAYFFSSNYTPINIPGGVNGWLVVLPNGGGTIIKQTWFRQGTNDSNDHQTWVRTGTNNGSSWSEWARIYTSKDTVANATNATNVYSTHTAPTSETWYQLMFASASNTDGNKSLRHNSSINVGFNVGTTDAVGRGIMTVGNSTASGTAGNMRGCLRIYDTNSNYVNFYGGNSTLTANRNIYLPNASGTVALTSNPSDISPTSAITYNLGTTALPWKYAYARGHEIYDASSNNYGYLRAYTLGTTETTGATRLTLGNNKASGVDGNAQGVIYMFGTSSGNTKITPGNNTTSNITLTLPASSGTLSLTSDPTMKYATKGSFTSGSKTLNVATGDKISVYFNEFALEITVYSSSKMMGSLIQKGVTGSDVSSSVYVNVASISTISNILSVSISDGVVTLTHADSSATVYYLHYHIGS